MPTRRRTQHSGAKSPRHLRQLRAEIQARANDAEEADNAKNLQLADLTNQALPTKPARKRRKRFNRADDADDSIPNPATLEERVREAGRHFIVEKALHLVDSRLTWTVDLDEEFDFAAEFESKADKVQGQLHDVIALLPSDAVPLRTQPWIAGAFEDGMSGQRSTISNRLRRASLQVLVGADQLKHFRSSNSRFDAFAKLIGYKPATETKAAHYSAFDAEILYDDYDGTVNVNKIFRNPLLLKGTSFSLFNVIAHLSQIYACILRGPYGAEGLFEGEYHKPQASCVQQIHNITCTSTGAISNCTVLATWMLRGSITADVTQLMPSGCATESWNNKSWAVDLLKYWDSILFPNNEESADLSGAHEGEDDMDLVDEAFDRAPSVPDTEDTTPEKTNDHALSVDPTARRQSLRTNTKRDDDSDRNDNSDRDDDSDHDESNRNDKSDRDDGSRSPTPPARSGDSRVGHERHGQEQLGVDKRKELVKWRR
ncbi:hypothetical protein B0H14DRAFT_3525296 [Mycena olivaceomarginata]|nr:hypothetical protein B0H14DRAFT_3525296 [Mycena olivaceomarginata]